MSLLMEKIIFCSIIFLSQIIKIDGQSNGNSWIFGYSSGDQYSGGNINFNLNPPGVIGVDMEMKLEGSNTSMCDSLGNLLFYSNGCFIANRNNEIMLNGDSIGMGKLRTSFCKTGGNPQLQGIISVPSPSSKDLYYLFYTDIDDPYEFPIGLYFPLAPTHLFYSIIDMKLDNGRGGVTIKNELLVNDTLSRGMITAVRHYNNNNWWIIVPESHSNCYYTILVNENGVDTTFLQCTGTEWNDNDASGQAVFSPNGKEYVRFNRFNGLNAYKFNSSTGILDFYFDIPFHQDSFDWAGVAFSPNSRFLYATATDKVYQFDFLTSDVAMSKTLVGELRTPIKDTALTEFNLIMLGPDGKLYIGGTTPHNYLHVINHPNCLGQLCDLQQYSIELPVYNLYGMPNVPNYKDWDEMEKCDTIVNLVNAKFDFQISIYPNPFLNTLCVSANTYYTFLDFKLYNSNGLLVYSTKIDDFPKCQPLESIPSGLYYFCISSDKFSYHGKVIKQ